MATPLHCTLYGHQNCKQICQGMDETFKRHVILYEWKWIMFGNHPNFEVRKPKLVVSAKNEGECVRLDIYLL